MEYLAIVAIFATIIIMTRLKLPLYLCVAGATVVTGLVYGMPIGDFFSAVWSGASGKSTLILLGVVYLMTYIQTMMSRHKMLDSAESSMASLLNNRRISTALTPVLMGLMSAPGAVLMASEVVDDSVKDRLPPDIKAFIASWYRHIPESSLPTYSGVIMAITITGIAAGKFLLVMFPFVIFMFSAPFLVYMKKIPRETGADPALSKKWFLKEALRSLWPIILMVVLILGMGYLPAVSAYSTIIACPICIIALFFVGKYPAKTVLPTCKEAFKLTMLLSTLSSMIFKSVLSATPAVGLLTQGLRNLPIPLFLALSLLFFAGSLVSGFSTFLPIALPIIISSMGYADLPMIALCMASGHLASQINPTHICLTLACNYFKVGLGDLIKRTLPVIGITYAALLLYYLGLSIVF